jgi:hypothetical protein
MVTTEGVPAHFIVAAASQHAITVALQLLETYRQQLVVSGDKGYLGLSKRLSNPADYQLIIQQRENQPANTAEEKLFLAHPCCLSQSLGGKTPAEYQKSHFLTSTTGIECIWPAFR